MCHIYQTNPTKFRTIKVKNSGVRDRLALGDKRGACSKHCDTLCPNETCDIASGQCRSKAVFQCSGPPTCPGQRCICECQDLGGEIGKKFATQSFLEGLYHEETPGKVNITNEEGLVYEVSANLTTRSEGIVSLADAYDLISSVTCVNPSMIKIDFKDSLNKNESLADMFPLGAILVVKAEVFGYCMENSILSDPSDEEMEYDRDLYRLAVDEGDGYLIISNFSQDSATTVTVSGDRGSFFNMFDQGNIQFQMIEDPSRRKLLERGLNFEKKLHFFKNKTTLKLKGRITETSGIKSAVFDFGWWGFEFKIILVSENKMTAEAETYVAVGAEPQNSAFMNVFSQLLGPPPLAMLSYAQKAGVFKLLGNMPDMKVGVYLELVTYLKLLQAEIVVPILPKVKLTYTSGKKEVSVNVVFRPFDFNVDSGIKAAVVKNENSDVDVEFTWESGDMQIRFKVFLAFQPQLVYCMTDLFIFGVGVPFGPELYLQTKVIGLFSPLKDETGGPALIGNCDTCHKMQGTLDAVLKSPFAAGRLVTPVKMISYKQIDLLPGLDFRMYLLRLCFIRASCGSSDPCSGSSDPCCGNPDPCCGNSNPCCGSTDPCCGKTDPCCGSTDPFCSFPQCRADVYDGRCFDSTADCDLALASSDCASGKICCVKNDVPCSASGYAGKCMVKDKCKTGGGATISGLCPGQTIIQCCLKSPKAPECTANDKYPGECKTMDQCNGLPGRTPLSPTPEFGCSGGNVCCVESPVCSSGLSAFGKCVHSSTCKHELVVKEGEALCPGDKSIQCCIELPTCDVDGVQGQCQDEDTCGGSKKYAVSNECPGDSEVKCCVELPSCSVSAGFDGQCMPKEKCSGLPALSWHNCPGKNSNDVACCLPEGLVCYAPSGDVGKCQTSCSRTAEGSNLCPAGLSCCLQPLCNIGGVQGQCQDEKTCVGSKKYPVSGDCAEGKCCVELPSCSVSAGFDGQCMPVERCSGLPALSWHNCPGRESNGVACCLPEGLVCYANISNVVRVGECQRSCNQTAEGLNLCPAGLSCCLKDCNMTDPAVQCCVNSECEEENGFICSENQCICGHECCSDNNCGDISLFKCVENSCRNRECNVTSGTVECCVDSDCALGRICEENNCISNGNPRFTLSWYGNDDLDLHVFTPSRVEIWFGMTLDNESKGQLDQDDVPEYSARWTENIFFPTDGSAPKGTYEYFVNNYRQINQTDNWTLSVYLNEQRLQFHSGATQDSSNSTVYAYVHQ